MHRADRVGERDRVDVLVHVAAAPARSAGTTVRCSVKLVTMRTRAGLSRLAQQAQRLDAVGTGHPDVHQDHVGPQFHGAGHALGAVARLADHLDVALDLQERPQTPADHLMVVDQQHADPHYSSATWHLHLDHGPLPGSDCT